MVHKKYLCRAPKILLIGAGPSTPELIAELSLNFDAIVAADGGFVSAQQAKLEVALVVGDMDSQLDLPASQAAAHITDQETTDFQNASQFVMLTFFWVWGFSVGVWIISWQLSRPS